jgi:hypothetical protein
MRTGQHTAWADAQEAQYHAVLHEQDRAEHFATQMVADWLDGYVLLGRRSVDAHDEFGSLAKAADAIANLLGPGGGPFTIDAAPRIAFDLAAERYAIEQLTLERSNAD